MHYWFRLWKRKQFRMKRSLRGTHIFRIWGHKLFANFLWKMDKHSLAGGLSLGLFVAFLPTIGFQMIIAAFGAIVFKVNLPLALLACWVTNPVTAIPVYTAEWHLGRYILEDFVLLKETFDLYNMEGRAVRMILHGIYIWTGSLVFSSVSAALGNIGVRVIWNCLSKVKEKQKKLKSGQ
jgi:uncharacterized protein